MQTSFENTYEYAPLSKFRTQTVAFMPVLVDLGERGYVLYTESDVESYRALYLTYDKEARGFAAPVSLEYPTETSLTNVFRTSWSGAPTTSPASTAGAAIRGASWPTPRRRPNCP